MNLLKVAIVVCSIGFLAHTANAESYQMDIVSDPDGNLAVLSDIKQLDFGKMKGGEVKIKTFDIKNKTGFLLDFKGFGVTGVNYILSGYNYPLPPGASTRFTVKFSAPATGPFQEYKGTAYGAFGNTAQNITVRVDVTMKAKVVQP